MARRARATCRNSRQQLEKPRKRTRECPRTPARAAGAAGGVITSANPPRTARASCCVKSERPRRFLGRGRLRFSPVKRTPRNPVRSAWASPRGPSQEPLDGRNLATLGSLGPRRAAGWMALDSGDRLADFRGRRRRRSVRIGVLPRTSSGGLSLNGPGAWRAPSHNRAGPCRFCEALPMDRSMNGGAIATRAPAVREPSEARQRAQERARTAHRLARRPACRRSDAQRRRRRLGAGRPPARSTPHGARHGGADPARKEPHRVPCPDGPAPVGDARHLLPTRRRGAGRPAAWAQDPALAAPAEHPSRAQESSTVAKAKSVAPAASAPSIACARPYRCVDREVLLIHAERSPWSAENET